MRGGKDRPYCYNGVKCQPQMSIIVSSLYPDQSSHTESCGCRGVFPGGRGRRRESQRSEAQEAVFPTIMILLLLSKSSEIFKNVKEQFQSFLYLLF